MSFLLHRCSLMLSPRLSVYRGEQEKVAEEHSRAVLSPYRHVVSFQAIAFCRSHEQNSNPTSLDLLIQFVIHFPYDLVLRKNCQFLLNILVYFQCHFFPWEKSIWSSFILSLLSLRNVLTFSSFLNSLILLTIFMCFSPLFLISLNVFDYYLFSLFHLSFFKYFTFSHSFII